MAEKWSSMHSPELTLLRIGLNLSGLITRQPDTFAINSCNVGFAAIPDQCIAFTTKGFIGSLFQRLLELFSIKDVCSTSKNRQSNAVCERIYQTVSNVLRTLVHVNPPQNMTQARDIIDDALATAMHAMHTMVAKP
eukprot:CCRYP_002120-RA/>CCRYP_002120-RA protein AED:0.44 eAED:0.68 QI:0/0/0/1/0/0/2/0/135